MYVRFFALIGLGLTVGLGACGDDASSDDDNPPAGEDGGPSAQCALDSDCSDGLFCNGVEVCDTAAGGICVAGVAPTVDDGIGCTVDMCDENNDTVVHMLDHGSCDDGAFCNGAETCDPLADCVAGAPPVADDGVECTVDTCDEDSDTIVSTPDSSLCDDGLFCNGTEFCDPVADCQAGVSPVIDDGLRCTVESCDEDTDKVIRTPDDTLCDDGAFCNGVETCDPVADCVAGTPPVTDDGVACTNDLCDEASDTVTNIPDDSSCDNGDVCDGAEFCDSLADCRPGAAPTSEAANASQSTDTQKVVNANTIACGTAGIHTDNSYYRVFDLAAHGFACDFEVSSVDIAIELADAGADLLEQPLEIKLHTLSGSLQMSNLTEVAAVSVSIPDQDLNQINVPISATVAATDTLVVEIFTPNGQSAGHSLFIGSNAAGQTEPTYIRAVSCGVSEPTDVATLGFPNMHLIMTVNGTSTAMVP